MKRILITLFVCLFASSCGTLRPAVSTSFSSLDGYKYAYVAPTSGIQATSGMMFGTQYGVYGESTTYSSNPSELISGYLMKKGFIITPEVKNDIVDRTIIVSYGESGKRSCGLGYAHEVTIQILNAQSMEVICTCSAEGQGETEADDIRMAINRCLDKVFE